MSQRWMCIPIFGTYVIYMRSEVLYTYHFGVGFFALSVLTISGMRRPQRLRTGNAGVHALLNALEITHFFNLAYRLLTPNAHGKQKPQTKMTDKLLFRIYGEMYLVDLPHVLYFKADDHYTHVYTDSGTHMVMPFGLSKVETAIAQRLPENNFLLRLGRSHIVNIQYIYHVNMLKQSVLLADSHGQMHPLHFSRQVLQSLMEHLER